MTDDAPNNRTAQHMKSFSTLKNELAASAKWSGILFLPVVILIVCVFGALGGIHGDGKLLFLVTLAPVMGIERFVDGASPVVVWPAIVVVEWFYFFLLVALLRALHLHTLVARIVNMSIPHFKAKPPGQS